MEPQDALNTVVVKTHSTSKIKAHPIDGCIIIMRKPQDAILSDYALDIKASHSKPISSEDLESDHWQHFPKRWSGFKGWYNTYKAAIDHCRPDKSKPETNIYVIHYEFIKSNIQNLIQEMQGAVNFLRKNNPNLDIPFQTKCLLENNEGSYHRPHKEKLDMGKYITLEEKIKANAYIEKLNDTFIEKIGPANGALLAEYLFDVTETLEELDEESTSDEVIDEILNEGTPEAQQQLKEKLNTEITDQKNDGKAEEKEEANIIAEEKLENPEPKPDDEPELDCSASLGPVNQFAMIPLLSFPGSGNTWSRFLIEQSTGFLTGSSYHDGRLAKHLKGELQPYGNGRTVVVKTHSMGRIGLKSQGCIFILRNPKDAILSDFALAKHRSHSIPVTDEDMQSETWKKFGKRTSGFRSWAATYTKPIYKCNGQIFIIWYERIKENLDELIHEMQDLTEFVNDINHESFNARQEAWNTDNEKSKASHTPALVVKTEDIADLDFPDVIDLPFRPECLKANNEGMYHRKYAKKIDIDQYFTVEEKTAANDVVKKLNDSLVAVIGDKGVLPQEYYFKI